MAIPHFIVLFFLVIAFIGVSVAAFFAIRASYDMTSQAILDVVSSVRSAGPLREAP